MRHVSSAACGTACGTAWPSTNGSTDASASTCTRAPSSRTLMKGSTTRDRTYFTVGTSNRRACESTCPVRRRSGRRRVRPQAGCFCFPSRAAHRHDACALRGLQHNCHTVPHRRPIVRLQRDRHKPVAWRLRCRIEHVTMAQLLHCRISGVVQRGSVGHAQPKHRDLVCPRSWHMYC